MTVLRPFMQVDVFTERPYFGNPLAVVLDGDGLDDAEMQRFAKWTNLSETSFLLPATHPEADYRLRIFTPAGELDFAGHPTLGSAHAWLQHGGQPRSSHKLVQQCNVGLISLRRFENDSLAFLAPGLRRTSPDATLLKRVSEALGVTENRIVAAQILDNGTRWFGILLDDPSLVAGLLPDHQALIHLGVKVGVAARIPAGATPDADLLVRAFVVLGGGNEDPVTGSLNAGLAQWLIADQYMPRSYIATQGQSLGRCGLLSIEWDDQDQVWVGGHSKTCIQGQVGLG